MDLDLRDVGKGGRLFWVRYSGAPFFTVQLSTRGILSVRSSRDTSAVISFLSHYTAYHSLRRRDGDCDLAAMAIHVPPTLITSLAAIVITDEGATPVNLPRYKPHSTSHPSPIR